MIIAALTGLLAALVVAVVVLVIRRRPEPEASRLERLIPESLDALRLELRTSLDGTTQTLNQRLSQFSTQFDSRLHEMRGEVGQRLDTTSGMIGDRLDGASRTMADVHQQLSNVQGATQRVLEVGKDIASLQQILRAPKMRGGLGELFLGELLSQVLPSDAFGLQHSFRGGHRVDAVVKLGGKLVPVDAKFPLENFTRIGSAADEAQKVFARRTFVADVKKRIDEIAQRYIVPDEGTFDFALMYIPAENIYYETIIREQTDTGVGLFEYSLKRKVIPVSPNTLYAYLQVVVLGLRGLRIEERAHEILRGLEGIGQDLDKFRAEFQTLGKHLDDAGKKYHEGSRRLQRVQDSVERLEELDDEPVERPAAANQ